jgi:hypothetical protein
MADLQARKRPWRSWFSYEQKKTLRRLRMWQLKDSFGPSIENAPPQQIWVVISPPTHYQLTPEFFIGAMISSDPPQENTGPSCRLDGRFSVNPPWSQRFQRMKEVGYLLEIMLFGNLYYEMLFFPFVPDFSSVCPVHKALWRSQILSKLETTLRLSKRLKLDWWWGWRKIPQRLGVATGVCDDGKLSLTLPKCSDIILLLST